jgi:hypothetical protein
MHDVDVSPQDRDDSLAGGYGALELVAAGRALDEIGG